MPAERILQNGSAAVGGDTDKFGWKYMTTENGQVVQTQIKEIKNAIVDLGGNI